MYRICCIFVSIKQLKNSSYDFSRRTNIMAKVTRIINGVEDKRTVLKTGSYEEMRSYFDSLRNRVLMSNRFNLRYNSKNMFGAVDSQKTFIFQLHK